MAKNLILVNTNPDILKYDNRKVLELAQTLGRSLTSRNLAIRLYLIAFIAVFTLTTASLNAITFTSVDELGKWLSAQPDNTAATPYTVSLNVSDLGGTADTPGSVGYTLEANDTKFVSLDLSGSTITTIPEYAFLINRSLRIPMGCLTLTGITIPNIRKTARFA